VAFVALSPSAIEGSPSTLTSKLQDNLEANLHSYLVPVFTHALPSLPVLSVPPAIASKHDNANATVIDLPKLRDEALRIYASNSVILPHNDVEAQLEAVWRLQFGVKTAISVTASFFELGGDSLKAGQLINALRKALKVPLSVADIFTHPTIESLASKVQGVLGPSGAASAVGTCTPVSIPMSYRTLSADSERRFPERADYESFEHSSTLPSDSWGCLLTQAAPLVLLYPLTRIAAWFLIAAYWVEMINLGMNRFYGLLVAILLTGATVSVAAPLVGIVAKWVIIGRYKAGRYPLWGSMYLR
jgi:acyl carrier protein